MTSETRQRPLAQPPDWAERRRALDPTRSFLVQAPAGSGKTHLLTQRFLRLLAEAEKPEEIVAITFTKAAAAEMRNRILAELEKAEREIEKHKETDPEDESLSALAQRALARANQRGWQVLDQPGQLRITTIDAFCRGLALQCPLGWGPLSGLGGRLETVEDTKELYRRAARRTLEVLAGPDSATRRSIEALLLWRDNHWNDVEDQIVSMLAERNRWYQEFVFDRTVDWVALRKQLEAPFQRSAIRHARALYRRLEALEGGTAAILELARFACEDPGRDSPHDLAECSELPTSSFADEEIEGVLTTLHCAAKFLLTGNGTWRLPRGLTKHHGFPTGDRGSLQKARFGQLVEAFAEEPGLENALKAFRTPLPIVYTEEEWELVRHCFAVLRTAAAELQLVFAETGTADFTEVAQIALRVLAPEDGFPPDFAIQLGDGIRHLLVDEFQDTSRNQHRLLSRIIGAWPEREGRSCFCVGDPMQSIYGFREAEVELFERLKTHGLEIETAEPFPFEFLSLRANFRTEPSLVEDLNSRFESIFAEDDGSGVRFSAATAAREPTMPTRTELHLNFTEQSQGKVEQAGPNDPAHTQQMQTNEIAELIREHLATMDALRAGLDPPEKYRIAVLARAKRSLMPLAHALRDANIPFRAIELVTLRERPEVLDVLSLARALLNPADRVAWLGVLRAPWCGLTLAELHVLVSEDETETLAKTIPELLQARLPLLAESRRISQQAATSIDRVSRLLRTTSEARPRSAAGLPGDGPPQRLGSWLESIWKALGGEDTVTLEERGNLDLLWSCLDRLPEGEADLMGPALSASLDKLFAQPDPAASSDFGVQLMTIHKSKGLEFEIVVVPELEARSRRSQKTMISWLERGLAEPGTNGELTEFLIAPIQAKGEESSLTKSWVEGVKRLREIQEMRRLLYVATTRARQQLHLFARPRYSIHRDGKLKLEKASDSLLATAWPAFQAEIEARFLELTVDLATAAGDKPGEETVPALAAAADAGGNRVITMPASIRPTKLRRLPASYAAPEFSRFAGIPPAQSGAEPEGLYTRTEGGLESRLEGRAVHRMLEMLSGVRRRMDTNAALENLEESLPAVVSMIRSYGVVLGKAKQLAERALVITRRAAQDPLGAWILAPHTIAFSETKWTGFIRGRRWNLQPDRVFFAPPWNGVNEEPGWWIIDYKTAYASGDHADDNQFLVAKREKYSEQLATYAEVLRGDLNSQEKGTPIRLGIYYPRMTLFDWWPAN